MLANTINPDFLLVTNIYHTHFDRISTLKEVAAHKMKLAKNSLCSPQVVLLGDDRYLKDYVNSQTITFGFEKSNDYVIKNIKFCGEKGMNFTISFFGVDYIVSTPLIGRHNVLNAAGVFALCHSIGIDAETIKTGIFKFNGIYHINYETPSIKTVKGIKFYDDSQHFNLPGLKSGLEAFTELTKHGSTLILGYDYKFQSKNFCPNDFKKNIGQI